VIVETTLLDNWHYGKTAELLGISPSTLYRRLRDYNLERRG
jgi:transcriptional regulator of acetoin/glycerol metabolism